VSSLLAFTWGQFFQIALTLTCFFRILAAHLFFMASDARYYRLAMRIFADFSGSIAIPAVLAALLGKWLDEKYGTEPRYIALLLILALILTSVILVRKSKKYLAEYEKLMQ